VRSGPLRILPALLSLLVAAALSVQAGDLPPVASDALGNTYHLDTAGMTRKGYVVYLWQLQNLAQRDGNGALSVRSQVEFDCRFRRVRTMWMNLHMEHDEGGKLISSGMVNRPEWAPVMPDTPAETLLDHACRHIMR
jgi:hypothetical protein